ncbi:MAG: hypothetical protein AAGA77_24590 [Bacteroidota bacterium]
MTKFKIASLFIFLVIFGISNGNAQKESVILYNLQPVKVELSEKGEIESFIKTVPGHMDGYSIKPDPIVVQPTEIKKPVLPVTAKNAEYKVVSTEREELTYKTNFATLDRSAISKLNKIAAKLKADPNAKLLLTAHKLNADKSVLVSNRLESAVSYLGIKGILSYRIQTDIQISEKLKDVIAINYLN